MPISTLTKRKHLNQTLVLELDAARRVGDVLARARNDMATRLSDSTTHQGIRAAVDDATQELTTRVANETDYQESLRTGHQQGLELTLNSADVPPSSVIYEFQPLVDLNALAVARSRTLELLQQTTQDLRSRAFQEIQTSVALGEGTKATMDRILGTGLSGANGRDGVFRAARFRAEAIARTTTNEVLNAGKLSTYEQMDSGFPELELRKQWDNIGDNRTSPICSELLGQVVPLNEQFISSRGSWNAPPAHPFAYLPGAELVSPIPEILVRMSYQGKAVTIKTSTGQKLSVTIDHPVLTQRGFVAAGNLSIRDSVFVSSNLQRTVVPGPNNQSTVTSIEDCFESSRVFSPFCVVPVSTVDLDSQVPNHKIDVESAYRYLSQVKDTISSKPITERYFELGAAGLVTSKTEPGQSTTFGVLNSPLSVAPCLVSATGHSFSGIDGLLFIEDFLSDGVGTHDAARLLDRTFNSGFVAAQESGDFVTTNWGLVHSANTGVKGLRSGTFDFEQVEIVEVDVFDYSGHVFHLQDGTGIQIANGIVAHNCRSTLVPVTKQYKASWERGIQDRKTTIPPADPTIPKVSVRSPSVSVVTGTGLPELVPLKPQLRGFGNVNLTQKDVNTVLGYASTGLERTNKNKLREFMNYFPNSTRIVEVRDNYSDQEINEIYAFWRLYGTSTERLRAIYQENTDAGGYTWEHDRANDVIVNVLPGMKRGGLLPKDQDEWRQRINEKVLQLPLGAERPMLTKASVYHSSQKEMGTLIHEWGHRVHGMAGKLDKIPSRSFSQYAEDDPPSEWVAEHFVLWTLAPDEYMAVDPVGYGVIDDLVTKALRVTQDRAPVAQRKRTQKQRKKRT